MNTQADKLSNVTTIDELEELVTPLTNREPRRLSIRKIQTLPDLLQPRDVEVYEHHVGDLERQLKAHKDLDPILVLYCGDDSVVVDGHHRLEAYKRQERKSIPVRYYKGTAEEATREAGKRNSKAVLPMTSKERMNYAWRLVLRGKASIAETASAAGISPRQVTLMRKRFKELGDSAHEFREWWQAQKELDARQALTDEERSEWLEAQAQDRANRLSKEFGGKLSSNLAIAARSLEIHFGRKFFDLVEELVHQLPEPLREQLEEGLRIELEEESDF